MDDEAASQQLMSEARATTHSADYEGPAIPLNLNGISEKTTSRNPKSGKRKAKKPRNMQVPPSQTSHHDSPRSYSREDLQAFISASPMKTRSSVPSTQVEVPDTQTETQTNGAPSSTPLNTSHATSPNASKRRSKRSKKNVQSEADLNNGNTIPATPYEEVAEEDVSSPEATQGQVSQGRRKEDKSQTSVNGVSLESEEISETPASTHEPATETAAEAVDQQDGVLEANEEALTPRSLLGKLNAERLQNSQSAGEASSPTKTPHNAPKDLHADEDLPDAAVTPITTPTSGATQNAKKRKRVKKGKAVAESPLLDWEAPVRNLGETSPQPFAFEDIDSDDAGASSHRKKPTKDKKVTRHSIGGSARRNRTSRADPDKTYERAHDDDDDRTAADRALEKTHELGHPPEKRTSGEYTADEKELLRRAIRDYQERNSLDTADLVEIIQWARHRKAEMGSNTTEQTGAQFKKDCDAFWEDINNAGLLRKRRDLRRHIRITYHTCQRGRWSQDEDAQLQELVNLHPGQWKLIATQLNRLELDAYNRWKDYVRHGENRNTKRWSQDEEANLLRVLSVVCQRVEDLRAERGEPPLDDYHDIINWHEVCREMGDTRSRLQCQSKWKIMRARMPPATLDVEIKPRTAQPSNEAPPDHEGAKKETQKKRRKSKVKKDDQPAATEVEMKPPGPDDMLWGDKLDLVAELIQQATANESESNDQIIWQDVAEAMDQKWSVRTLQTAFKRLCEQILDPEAEEDLMTRLGALLHFIKENHLVDAEDRYQPAQELDVNTEDQSQTKSIKKRKRVSSATSGQDSAKKRSRTTTGAAKPFKSKELITDSDNAESEPEL
ncbi:hypothetical protein OPT61_g7424 [Boeremia exigua]|uniref:Uncharacterized protein n=1 Tax=Boeremia exigua TaxID=749465 RepID=A0ACC2I2W2_9PLEO|nr:hypothetical protein OPT61_g7424 [Boeremia exigua]